MKKILLIFLFSYLFLNTLLANESYKKMLFNKWLNINGYEKYLDKTSSPVGMELDRSICNPKSTWTCVDADGKVIPSKDRKYKKIYPNNLNIKLNKKKNNLAYKSNPNRDTLIYYLWNYSYRRAMINPQFTFYEIKPSKKLRSEFFP